METDYNHVLAFKEYHAVSLHFKSPRYDFFKYNGKTKYNGKSNNRTEYIFKKLTNKYDRRILLTFFAKKFLENPKYYLFAEPIDKLYYEINDHIKRLEGVFYHCTTEIEEFLNDAAVLKSDEPLEAFKHSFSSANGKLPDILRNYTIGNLSHETIFLLNDCFNIFEKWDSKISSDLIWKNLYPRIKKFQPFWQNFIDIDKEKFVYLLINKLSL